MTHADRARLALHLAELVEERGAGDVARLFSIAPWRVAEWSQGRGLTEGWRRWLARRLPQLRYGKWTYLVEAPSCAWWAPGGAA
jgi:hypothetical protein